MQWPQYQQVMQHLLQMASRLNTHNQTIESGGQIKKVAPKYNKLAPSLTYSEINILKDKIFQRLNNIAYQ